jgi:hypothetical protein
MDGCKICSNNFQHSPDSLVLCNHKDGLVHMGCCTAKCSWDGAPCQNGVAIYSKKQ